MTVDSFEATTTDRADTTVSVEKVDTPAQPTPEEIQAETQERTARREQRDQVENLDRQKEKETILPEIEHAIDEYDIHPIHPSETNAYGGGLSLITRNVTAISNINAYRNANSAINPRNMAGSFMRMLNTIQQLFRNNTQHLRLNMTPHVITNLLRKRTEKSSASPSARGKERLGPNITAANNNTTSHDVVRYDRKQIDISSTSMQVAASAAAAPSSGTPVTNEQAEMNRYFEEFQKQTDQRFQDTIQRLKQREREIDSELRKYDEEYKKIIETFNPSYQQQSIDSAQNTDKTSLPAESETTDDWMSLEAKEAWMQRGNWVKMPDGSAYLYTDGILVRNSSEGICEQYIPESKSWQEHFNEHYDKDSKKFVENPQHSSFDYETQRWSVETLSADEEVRRVEALQAPVVNAMKRLESLIACEADAVQQLSDQHRNQNWLQHTANTLIDYNPYALELSKHEMKLSQMRSLKQQFEKEIEEAHSFGTTLDSANRLFRMVGMPEVTYGLFVITPDPQTYSFVKPDFSNNETWKLNEQNLALTRDTIVDGAFTVGTLGAGAAVNVGRKGAQMAGRKVIGALAKEGSLAATSSILKNADTVRSGEKTAMTAAQAVAIDTINGAATGVFIEKGAEKIADLFGAIRNKIQMKDTENKR